MFSSNRQHLSSLKYQVSTLTYDVIKVALIVIDAKVGLIVMCMMMIVVEVTEACLCDHASSHTDSNLAKSEVGLIL